MFALVTSACLIVPSFNFKCLFFSGIRLGTRQASSDVEMRGTLETAVVKDEEVRDLIAWIESCLSVVF